MILLQNHAGSKQKSYKNTTVKIFTTLDKVTSNTRNVTGLTCPAIKRTSVQVSDGRRNIA
jgi:hypothetical protein